MRLLVLLLLIWVCFLSLCQGFSLGRIRFTLSSSLSSSLSSMSRYSSKYSIRKYNQNIFHRLQCTNSNQNPRFPYSYNASNIRNFCIIAHIDHGKSTLADRILEQTQTVALRDMQQQLLDNHPIERERGITIKMQAARILYSDDDEKGQRTQYLYNLIDTPGHVDFGYEVSRSLAACEGALLVVDGTQGVEAQTLANVHLALSQGLAILPVVNKIDLPHANPAKTISEIETSLGLSCEHAVLCSAKTGEGVNKILRGIARYLPAPAIIARSVEPPLRALIFDSYFDKYKGVVAFVRVMDGTLRQGDKICFMNSKQEYEAIELGVMTPTQVPVSELRAGEVGYVAAGIRALDHARVGDTITTLSAMKAAGALLTSRSTDKNSLAPVPEVASDASGHHQSYSSTSVSQTFNPGQSDDSSLQPLPGYEPARAMVFAGFYPVDNDDYKNLLDAMSKLSLNDASFQFTPESSEAMGFGFRCGFLGLLHMEIVQERLEREYGLNLIVTAPSVVYKVLYRSGGRELEMMVDTPSKLPDENDIRAVLEPFAKLELITPTEFIGTIMDLAQTRRGEYVDMTYLSETRAKLVYEIPMGEVITSFFDELKSRSRGYASMAYHDIGFREADIVKLDIRLNGEIAAPLSSIVHRSQAYEIGRSICHKLKELIPREQFKIAIQASIGAKVIASEQISPVMKDVIAKLSGGDVTRKNKLLDKQKKGKKRMKMVGKVTIPQEAFNVIIQKN